MRHGLVPLSCRGGCSFLLDLPLAHLDWFTPHWRYRLISHCPPSPQASCRTNVANSSKHCLFSLSGCLFVLGVWLHPSYMREATRKMRQRDRLLSTWKRLQSLFFFPGHCWQRSHHLGEKRVTWSPWCSFLSSTLVSTSLALQLLSVLPSLCSSLSSSGGTN